MQPHPALPKIPPLDSWATSWATSWANVIGIMAGSTPDPASSHDNIRGGTFPAANPFSPQGATDIFAPLRALYFGARQPRATHWPSLARPVGRRLIRKIRNPH